MLHVRPLLHFIALLCCVLNDLDPDCCCCCWFAPAVVLTLVCSLLAPRYAVPKHLGVFRELTSPNHTTTSNIIQRIVDNRVAYEHRNAKKAKSEEAYYKSDAAYVKEV